MKKLLEELKANSKNRSSFAKRINKAIETNPELLNEIKEQTKFLDEHYYDVKLSLRTWHIWTGEGIQMCPVCGEKGRKISYTGYKFNKYFDTCGKKCNVIKRKQTNLEKYGVEHAMQSKEIRYKGKQTCMNLYGVENVFQAVEFKEKIKQTNLDRYGVEHASQSEEIKEKAKQTNLDRYGVECSSQVEEFQEKAKQTNLDRYGVEYVFQSQEIKEKAKQTIIERYGVENASQSEEIKEKAKQTRMERYGVEYASQSQEFKEKMKQTNLDRYGVEHASQSEEFKEKAKQTRMERYGVEHASQSEEFKEKAKQTNLDRYGVEYGFQSEEIKEKMKQTNLDRYGVEHAMQNIDILKRAQKSMYKSKPYTMPSGEVIIIQGYEHFYLDKYFANDLSESDIQHEPFNIHYVFKGKKCAYTPDMFIPSKNLIIEVKSKWSLNYEFDRNVAKRQACLDAGYNFEFVIFDRKGKEVNFRESLKQKKYIPKKSKKAS